MHTLAILTLALLGLVAKGLSCEVLDWRITGDLSTAPSDPNLVVTLVEDITVAMTGEEGIVAVDFDVAVSYSICSRAPVLSSIQCTPLEELGHKNERTGRQLFKPLHLLDEVVLRIEHKVPKQRLYEIGQPSNSFSALNITKWLASIHGTTISAAHTSESLFQPCRTKSDITATLSLPATTGSEVSLCGQRSNYLAHGIGTESCFLCLDSRQSNNQTLSRCGNVVPNDMGNFSAVVPAMRLNSEDMTLHLEVMYGYMQQDAAVLPADRIATCRSLMYAQTSFHPLHFFVEISYPLKVLFILVPLGTFLLYFGTRFLCSNASSSTALLVAAVMILSDMILIGGAFLYPLCSVAVGGYGFTFMDWAFLLGMNGLFLFLFFQLDAFLAKRITLPPAFSQFYAKACLPALNNALPVWLPVPVLLVLFYAWTILYMTLDFVYLNEMFVLTAIILVVSAVVNRNRRKQSPGLPQFMPVNAYPTRSALRAKYTSPPPN